MKTLLLALILLQPFCARAAFGPARVTPENAKQLGFEIRVAVTPETRNKKDVVSHDYRITIKSLRTELDLSHLAAILVSKAENGSSLAAPLQETVHKSTRTTREYGISFTVDYLKTIDIRFGNSKDPPESYEFHLVDFVEHPEHIVEAERGVGHQSEK